jgi:hypothetical protein
LLPGAFAVVGMGRYLRDRTWVNLIVRVRERCEDLFGLNGWRWQVIRTGNASTDCFAGANVGIHVGAPEPVVRLPGVAHHQQRVRTPRHLLRGVHAGSNGSLAHRPYLVKYFQRRNLGEFVMAVLDGGAKLKTLNIITREVSDTSPDAE